MSVSVDACNWVSAMTRSKPIRAPASLASVVRSWIWESSTSASGLSVAWITPTVRPMMETGTHSAEMRPCGRLRSFGQASRWSLSAKTCTWARRAAGQRSGESTLQDGRFAVGPDAGHAQQMGVAVVGQQELDRRVRHDGGERPLNDVDDLGLALGHVQRIGQAALEALALALQLPGDPFAVGDLDRLTELGVSARTLSSVLRC